MATESLDGYPLGPQKFPFAAYEVVLPDEGESWIGAADRSGSRLSRVRRASTGRWVKLEALCTARGCQAQWPCCSHKLYWHVRLTLAGGDTQRRHYVQYARLILFASQGLPCAPDSIEDYVVHHHGYRGLKNTHRLLILLKKRALGTLAYALTFVAVAVCTFHSQQVC